MKKITLKEIAAMADVSVMTVSNVIRGKDARVSLETKNKIEALIKDYHYVPNQNASNLRSGKSKLIGVLFYKASGETDFTDPFISSVLTGIKKVANEKGYFTMIHSVHNKKGIEDLQQNWAFAGFVVIGASSIEFVKIDRAISTPVSYIDTYWQENQVLEEKARNFIGTDEEKISETVANYLNAMGHERVLFYSFEFDEAEPGVIEKRYHAFLKYFKGEIILLSTPNPSYQAILESVAPYLMEQPFTAIYATADILAANLNQIFKDISIIGVDNAQFDQFISPKLTTLAINQIEKGEISMLNLIASIEKGSSADFYSDSKLIERDSVRKLEK
ncbi:MAG: LacI family transcriptional regulator [Streptococcaceae bacterium]|nr:LacI family transcriptional regulator [Streptococcaceae bacterium]